MKAKRVTVSFEYTNFDCLEIMIDRLKSELMEGKEYFEDMIKDQNENKIDISNLTNGLYFISVKQKKKSYTQKLFKQ